MPMPSTLLSLSHSHLYVLRYGCMDMGWGLFALFWWRAESSVAVVAHLREKRGQQTRVCAAPYCVSGFCDCGALSDRVFRRRSLPTVDPHLCCDSVSASCETDSIMGSNYKLDKDAFSRRLKRLYDLWRVSRTLCLQFSPADTDRSRRRRFQC